MKDHVEIDHLTKYNSFSVNRDQAMNLEIWFKIHTNISNFEIEKSYKLFYDFHDYIHVLFKMVKHTSSNFISASFK